MRLQSPEESCHVLTAQGLNDAGARVFVLNDASDHMCAVGAFALITADMSAAQANVAGEGGGVAVELKSMHVAAEQRGKGLGRILLTQLLAKAGEAGAGSAWLETGSDPSFAAARGLYESMGFVYCLPFGDYVKDPLSVFMVRPF